MSLGWESSMKTVLFILSFFTITTLFAKEIIVIGVAGGTGSGKTTLADQIKEAFPNDSVLVSQDNYYKDLGHLSFKEREQINFDHPDSIDFPYLKQQIMELKKGNAINKPIYNFQTHSRERDPEKVSPAQVIIVEGILLFAVSEVRDLFDVKIYIDADDDERLLRRIERDMNERARDFVSVRNQYLETVKPMHDVFVEPSKKYADLIVPRGGRNKTALSMIISKIKQEITPSKSQEKTL